MKLTLVGDTNLYGRARAVEAFRLIAPLLSGQDVLFGHAEGMFTHDARELPFKKIWHHSPPQTAGGFVEAGFDGVSFASNVCADRQAVADTVQAATQAGLGFCGIGLNLNQARQPLRVQRAGKTVALLSRTSVFWPPLVPASHDHPGAATVKAHTAYVPGRRAAEMPGSPPEIHTWPDADELEALRADLQATRHSADFVLLSMHWGISGSQEVQPYQRAIAYAAIEAGADVVFGHHPHVVQEIELYRGKPIFYSLGNFAFDLPTMHGRALEGLLVQLELVPGQVRGILIPVQRNAENLVRAMDPDNPAWQPMVSFLTEHAQPALRASMQVAGNELRFTC